MLFDSLGLDPSLIEALKAENITIPTDVQNKAIPLALKNKDLIVQSETGTGKTLAYLLPLFNKLNAAVRETQAVILVPTHELAIQVLRQIERLALNSGMKVSAAPIIGNVNIARQIEKLKSKPHILVGSPGRILELIKKRKIAAHTVKTVVLDEADRLMDKDNSDNVSAIVKSTLKERQMMLFSATITRDTVVRAKEILHEPEIISGEAQISIPETIEHVFFVSEQREKIDVLRKLTRILNPIKAVAFINQGDEIEIMTEKLKYHGIKAECIHGTNIKKDRKKTMDGFRNGKIQLLIASDLAARGLHIEGITHIFNLSIPEDAKDYLHRAGRTGRNGNAGMVISIVTDREIPLINMFEKTLSIKISAKDMYKGVIIEKRR